MLKRTLLVSAMGLAVFAPPVHSFSIVFDYSTDTLENASNETFFSNTTAKSVLESAGTYFSNLLEDSMSAINFGVASITMPGDTSGTTHSVSQSSAADSLTVFVGGVSLSGSTLGRGGPVFSTGSDSRGETGHTNDPTTATDFAPGYGRISFDYDASSNWYFDTDLSTDNDIPGTSSDFYSVALHELGHVLGLGAAASWDHWIVNNTGIGGTLDFTGPNSSAANGGDVELDAGEGHWLNGTTSLVEGISQEAAMDPSITQGTRKVFTDLDVAGLKDIGWEVSSNNVTPVPVPGAAWLMGGGLMGLVAYRRRRRIDQLAV